MSFQLYNYISRSNHNNGWNGGVHTTISLETTVEYGDDIDVSNTPP